MNTKILALSALMAFAVSSQANFVVNGDFEADVYANGTALYPLTSLTGWTILSTGNVAGIGLNYNPVAGFQAAPSQELDLSGSFDNFGNASGPGISQQVAHNLPGPLTLSFDIYTFSTGGSLAGGVDVYWEGTLLAAGLQDTGNARTNFTYSVLATTGTSELKFVSSNGFVSHVDNVSVVPEPATITLLAAAAALAARRKKRA